MHACMGACMDVCKEGSIHVRLFTLMARFECALECEYCMHMFEQNEYSMHKIEHEHDLSGPCARDPNIQRKKGKP